jgi:hypothetical protein
MVPLWRALRDLEKRFLAAQSSVPPRAPSEALADCLSILDELRGIDGRLNEAAERRDFPYSLERRRAFLNTYCRWLIRRVGTEFLLILRVHLERELKGMISPDALQVFQRLEEVDDAARDLEAEADHELMARVRDGSLLRDVLDQLRLQDVAGLDREVRSLKTSPDSGGG